MPNWELELGGKKPCAYRIREGKKKVVQPQDGAVRNEIRAESKPKDRQ